MFEFKNWLVLNNIGNAVTDKFLEVLAIENALNATVSYISEALEYSQEDSKEIQGRKLLNAILWMRWKAMIDRQGEINKLIELRDAHKRENPEKASEIERKSLSESSWKDAKKAYAQRKQFNLEEAKSLLQKLGYINLDRIEQNKNLTEEEKDEVVIQALYKAAEEKGNELPEDVRRLGFDKINRKAQKSEQFFWQSLMNVFQANYQGIAGSRRNQEREKSQGKARRMGWRNYGNDVDVASHFIERMRDLFVNRPVNQLQFRSGLPIFGKAENWFSPEKYKGPVLGSGGYDLEMSGKSEFTKEFARRIFGTLGSWLSKDIDKIERKRNQTASLKRVRDDVGNRLRKKSMIKSDLEKAKELKEKGQSPEPALQFYLNYLKSFHKDQQEFIRTSNKNDEYRKEIMDQIVSLNTRYPDLYSIDASKIESTLINYVVHVLNSSRSKKATYLGDLTQSTEEEDMYFDPEENDRVLRGDTGVRTPNNPEAIATNSENLTGILSVLHSVMVNLSNVDPKAAFAVCVKWNLGCSPSVGGTAQMPEINRLTVNSVQGFLALSVALTKTGKVSGGGSADCEKQLQSIGIKKAEDVAQRMNQIIPNLNSKTETVRKWINSGLAFICQEMRKKLDAISHSTQASEEDFD
jgi:hypothetical protein